MPIVIRHILQLPVDIFTVFPAHVKYKSYRSKYEIESITVNGNEKPTEDNPQGLGSYLELSGMGCDEIFRILDMHNETFGDLFKRCERWFNTDFHFTRLDVAIDDKNETPYFTIEQIKRKTEKEEYIANSNTHRFNSSKYQKLDLANTIYISAGKSDMIYRLFKNENSFRPQPPWTDVFYRNTVNSSDFL